MEKTKSNQRNPEEKKTADYYLLQAQDMLEIVKLLKVSANNGNPISQMLYGLYHACVGSNVPDQQDTSYAEALKWLYKTRYDTLSGQVIANILCTVPDMQPPLMINTSVHKQSGITLSDSAVADLLGLSIKVLNIDPDDINRLQEANIYTIGELVLNTRSVPLNNRSAQNVMWFVNHIKDHITITDTAARFIHEDNTKCASEAQQADPQ